MSSFAALLLAGGRSSRMGRDKALLRRANDSRTLAQHQLDTLRRLEPSDLFLSLAPAAPFEIPDDVTPVLDREPGLGPMAGIASTLALLERDLLVVLAVDLPLMNDAYLRVLLEKARGDGLGRIPRIQMRWEPLAAVWPKALSPRLDAALAERRLALQPLLSEAADEGIVAEHAVKPPEEFRFQNVNTPEDWNRIQARIDSCPGSQPG